MSKFKSSVNKESLFPGHMGLIQLGLLLFLPSGDRSFNEVEAEL